MPPMRHTRIAPSAPVMLWYGLPGGNPHAVAAGQAAGGVTVALGRGDPARVDVQTESLGGVLHRLVGLGVRQERVVVITHDAEDDAPVHRALPPVRGS